MRSLALALFLVPALAFGQAIPPESGGGGSGVAEDLLTAEMDTTKHLVPDGAGGAEWLVPAAAAPAGHNTSHENGGADEIDVTGLVGLPAAYDGGAVTNPFLAPDGTQGAPSYSFSNFTGTGFHALSANSVNFATAQNDRVNLSNNGLKVESTATFAFSSTSEPAGTEDVILNRDAANTLALRNSTAAQAFNIYNTYTDASNYERGTMRWDSNVFVVESQEAGTGSNRNLSLRATGDIYMQPTGSNIYMYKDPQPNSNDARNLGATSLQWQNLYLSRSIQGSKSKALTDATATAFVRVAIPQTIATNYKGGEIIYEIYCDDDTNQASQSGTVKFTCHNLAGTEACGFSTPDGVTLGDGTANLVAPVFTAATAAADTIDLQVDSNCTGIVPNTHTIEYRLDMPTTATLTPQ